MDAFFASVEQRENPALRGKAVIVGADPKGGLGRGVVAACSYEAREYGIHSAMPISQAFRRCPNGIYLMPHRSLYEQISRSLMGILSHFTDRVESVSIDEAFLDLTGCQPRTAPREAALQLKSAVQRELELTCSVGIASNKFVAKVASDFIKPDGLTEVPPGEERSFLTGLPVRRLWGVGPQTEKLLRKLKLTTIGEIAFLPLDFWKREFGRHGERLWHLAHGVDESPVCVQSERLSLSREHTFVADTEDISSAKRTLLLLCDDLARRIRELGLQAKTVTLKLRYEDFTTFTRQQSLELCTDDAMEIYRAASSLLETLLPLSRKIRLIGIRLSRLRENACQLALFEQWPRRKKLNASIDQIVQRFGENSIRPASLLNRRKN